MSGRPPPADRVGRPGEEAVEALGAQETHERRLVGAHPHPAGARVGAAQHTDQRAQTGPVERGHPAQVDQQRLGVRETSPQGTHDGRRAAHQLTVGASSSFPGLPGPSEGAAGWLRRMATSNIGGPSTFVLLPRSGGSRANPNRGQ